MQPVKKINNAVVGQNLIGIGMGDGSVVTKMKKNKKTELIFQYIPSRTIYTPQQEEDFANKENQVIDYLIEHILMKEALR